MSETAIVRIIEQKRDTLLAALPNHVDKDRFYQIVVSVVKSADLSRCTPESKALCVFGCAKLGLVPDPVLGHIHIIPRTLNKGKSNEVTVATLMPGYRGFIELGRRSGKVGDVHTGLVYKCDDFSYWVDENGPHMRHAPNLDGDRNPKNIIRAYCVTELVGARSAVEVMTAAQINACAKETDPWKFKWDEMARKTVVRRASKYWPMNAELAKAVDWDEQDERDEPQDLPRIDAAHAAAARTVADPLLGEVTGEVVNVQAEPGEDAWEADIVEQANATTGKK